ncbi:MAG: lysostaphin resistance A-like protein [Bacteroidota bacterium]
MPQQCWGGGLFSIWLIVGNLINSFMEEGLFRGLMLILFTVNLPFFQANLLQAVLFGGWHLPWVIKGLKIGQFKNSGEIILGTVSNFLPQFFMGAVWGYLYYRTNSLWAPIISHTLTNTALNFIHVRTDDGINNGITIRMGVYVIVMLLGVFYINKVSSWWNLKNLKINVR